MIELKTGRFTDLLPEHLRNTETKALAYAVGRQVWKLLALADGVPFYAGLDAAPEPVLDHLAVELRTPAYREAFPLETKRVLIRDSLLAYAKMGTPAAVDRTLSAIFGAGRIEEWFDYGGRPHHFRARIQAGGAVAREALERFLWIVSGVKRLSSWLDCIVIQIDIPPAVLHVGGGFGASVLAEAPAEPDKAAFQAALSACGAFGARAVPGLPEDTAPPPAASVLRTGCVCAILSVNPINP